MGPRSSRSLNNFTQLHIASTSASLDFRYILLRFRGNNTQNHTGQWWSSLTPGNVNRSTGRYLAAKTTPPRLPQTPNLCGYKSIATLQSILARQRSGENERRREAVFEPAGEGSKRSSKGQIQRQERGKKGNTWQLSLLFLLAHTWEQVTVLSFCLLSVRSLLEPSRQKLANARDITLPRTSHHY